jgi:hypothetical protein
MRDMYLCVLRQCRFSHRAQEVLLAQCTNDCFGSLVCLELTTSNRFVLFHVTLALLSCFITVSASHLEEDLKSKASVSFGRKI